MQRYVPVGAHRIHVISGVAHDPDGAKRAAQLVAALQPEAVVLATDLVTWSKDGHVADVEALALEHGGAGLQRNVLWQTVTEAARAQGAQVAVVDRTPASAPKKGVKELRRLLRKEGFEQSNDAANDVARFWSHYVARCPSLVPWVQETRHRHAARIRAAVEARPKRIVAVIAQPHADAVCDEMQHG